MKNASPWILAAAALLGVATLASPLSAAPAVKSAASAAVPELDRLSVDLQALSHRVGPAVVQIFAASFAPAPGGGNAVGGLLSRQRGTGSGVIVDPSGYIVTNAHVVAGAQRVQVQLAGPRPGAPGRSALKASGPRLDARVIGLDTETDIAVLKIETANLPTLSFADSDLLRQGQLALAFGSPLGLESSVTLGVISSTVRQMEPDSPMIYLQTDAAIHPGNSGGPLVDTRGAVVGINTFILSSPAGDAVGFAAPSNIVSAVYRQIREHGRVRRGAIGARGQTLTPELAGGLGIARDWGVILADVLPGSPAERAGLRAGDVVLTMDGKVLENARQMDVNLYRHEAGDQITLKVVRAGEERALAVTLSERPGDIERLASLARPEENLIEPLQILAVPVSAEISQLVSMREPWGVLVALSTGDAPPGGASLRPGDVIRSIGGITVRSLEDLRRELARRKRGDWVTLHVEREGRMTYVPCEIP